MTAMEALLAQAEAERLHAEWDELCGRADAEGWDEQTGRSHLNIAYGPVAVAYKRARDLRQAALASEQQQPRVEALEKAKEALRAWDAAVVLTVEDGRRKWRWTGSKLQHAFDLTRGALAALPATSGGEEERRSDANAVGCDASDLGPHQIEVQGSYKFCRACGETVTAPTMSERARKAEADLHKAEAELAEAREALRPFARFYDAMEMMGGNTPKSGSWHGLETKQTGLRELMVEDFRRARSLTNQDRSTTVEGE